MLHEIGITSIVHTHIRSPFLSIYMALITLYVKLPPLQYLICVNTFDYHHKFLYSHRCQPLCYLAKYL